MGLWLSETPQVFKCRHELCYFLIARQYLFLFLQSLLSERTHQLPNPAIPGSCLHPSLLSCLYPRSLYLPFLSQNHTVLDFILSLNVLSLHTIIQRVGQLVSPSSPRVLRSWDVGMSCLIFLVSQTLGSQIFVFSRVF